MGKPRTKKPGNRARRSGPWEDDSALPQALNHLDQFLETLELRTQRAHEHASEAVQGTRAAARAMQRADETRADLEAGRRLRDEIIAAVSIATAQVALIEAAAAAAIRSAFQQFVAARQWRRKALAAKTPARSRNREKGKSMDELGEMAAKAKEATAYAIADRNRLALNLAEVRVQAAELRRRANGTPEDGGQRERVMQQLEACEGHAAHLYQQLLAQTAVVDRLKADLRKLFERLPQSAATAADSRTSDRMARHGHN